jgi:hypothetical protein
VRSAARRAPRLGGGAAGEELLGVLDGEEAGQAVLGIEPGRTRRAARAGGRVAERGEPLEQLAVAGLGHEPRRGLGHVAERVGDAGQARGECRDDGGLAGGEIGRVRRVGGAIVQLRPRRLDEVPARREQAAQRRPPRVVERVQALLPQRCLVGAQAAPGAV